MALIFCNAEHPPCSIRVSSVARRSAFTCVDPRPIPSWRSWRLGGKNAAPLSGSRGWRRFFVFGPNWTLSEFMIFGFRRYSMAEQRLRQIAEIIKSSWKIQREICEQFLLTTKTGVATDTPGSNTDGRYRPMVFKNPLSIHSQSVFNPCSIRVSSVAKESVRSRTLPHGVFRGILGQFRPLVRRMRLAL
jgi:hypothetical protein